MFFSDWLDILLFKKKPADIAATTLGEGLKNLVIAGVIVGFLIGVLTYLAMGEMMALTGEAAAGAAMAVFGPAAIALGTIGVPIAVVIGVLIGGAILHLFCLIVGGKGSIANYIGVLAMIYAAIMGTAGAILAVIGIITALAGVYLMAIGVIGLLQFLVGLWQLVLVVLATQAVQQLSLGRAIVAVIVIPVIIVVVLAIVIGAIIFAAIMSAMPTMPGGFALP